MSSQQARAFWITAPGAGELRDEPLPARGSTDVLVATLFSGISRGTELLVFSGRVPEGERERMRAPFQAGEFPAPVKYGYCNVGLVEAGPAELIGLHVFSLFPHQTRFVIPAGAVHPLPPGLDPGRAVLAANMETALNGVWDAAILPGDRISVIGAGAVGCLVAWLAARIPGCEVCLVDVRPDREPIAHAIGASFALPADAPGDRDVVVHASGSPRGLATALACAAFESTIVEMSWYGTTPVTLELGAAFHARRLTIRSSQVGHVATAQRARWTHRRRMALALTLLADPALDVLITGESAFSDLPQTMRELASGATDGICHRIRY